MTTNKEHECTKAYGSIGKNAVYGAEEDILATG